MDPLQITFTISAADLVRFNIYHASRRVTHWLVIVAAALLIATTMPGNFPPSVVVILTLALTALMTLIMLGVTVIIAAVNYRPSRNRAVLGRHIVTLRTEGVQEQTLVSHGAWSWAAVPKIARTRSYIFIYVQQNAAHVIPIRAFASKTEANAFYEYAARGWNLAQSNAN